MLTATPINNRLSDFRHMAELFTRRDEAYFARTLGVNNLRGHFNNMEKALRKRLGGDGLDVGETSGRGPGEPGWRRDIPAPRRAAQPGLCAGEPDPRDRQGRRLSRNARPPQVADYSIRKTYGRCSICSRRHFAQEAAVHSPDYYPWPTTRGRQEHRSLRGEPPEAGRRPDPHPVPEALRELGRRVRAVLRPPAAKAAGVP